MDYNYYDDEDYSEYSGDEKDELFTDLQNKILFHFGNTIV
jgi:hypothetical protein